MTYSHLSLRAVCASLLLGSLSACTYLIPDDPNAPRYNNVTGQRHQPVMNAVKPTSDTRAPEMQAPLAAVPTAAPVTAVSATNLPPATEVTSTSPALRNSPFPPVDPVVQAKANQSLSGASTPSLVLKSPNAQASTVRPVNSEIIRQTPLENMPFQTAAASGLMHVPPYPSNDGAARLNDARRDLEQSRSQAVQAKDQLVRDAAQEPSMLPAAAPAPMPSTQSTITVPPRTVSPMPAPAPSSSYIAPLRLTPPPPLMAAPTSAPAPVAMAPAPAGAPRAFNPMAVTAPAPVAMAPIRLTPPTAASPAPVSVPAPAPVSVSALRPSSSSFNPLEGSTGTVYSSAAPTASEGYLPSSRYANRR